MTVQTHPVVIVDLTRVGWSSHFSTTLPRSIRASARAGDLVWLADDDVAPRLFRIVEVLDDGRRATYELVDQNAG